MPKSKLPAFQRARQPKQIEQRCEAILEAALLLFQEKGLEHVTLADIAKKVGTVKSNLYRYFDSREHIFLRVLQRQGAFWEQRVMTGLGELKGKGTVAQVSDVVTASFIAAVDYSTLISVINPVLEQRLTPKLVMDFRAAFYQRRKRLADALAAAMPGGNADKIFPLVLHIFMHVVGLWPLCHPAADARKLLDQREFAHLDLDFETEMKRFMIRVLS